MVNHGYGKDLFSADPNGLFYQQRLIKLASGLGRGIIIHVILST